MNDGRDTVRSYRSSGNLSAMTDLAARIREDVQRAVEQRDVKTTALRRSMAYHHNMRHKDFDALTHGLEARCHESRNRVLGAVESFCAEEEEINGRVTGFLAREGLVTGQERIEMLDVLQRQAEGRKRMENALFKFFREQGELRLALNEMLASAGKLKTRDLRLIIKELETHWESSHFSELLHRLRRGWGADVPAAVAGYSFIANQGGGDMGLADDMDDLANRILEERRQRKDYILNLHQDVKESLEEWRSYHEEMAKNLRSTLQEERSRRMAGEEERMNSFKDAHSALYAELTALRTGMQQRLGQFQRERENLEKQLTILFDELHKDLAQGEKQRLTDFRAQYSVIEENTKALHKETAKWLTELSSSRREMAAALRLTLRTGKEDLNRENQERLKAFEVFWGELRGDLNTILDETRSVLKHYGEDLKKAAAAWRLLWAGMKEEAAAPVEAPPAVEGQASVGADEEEEEAPSEGFPPVEPDLSTAVLKIIQDHPGLKIVEIEKMIGVARIKIGAVTKSLIDQGKIRKEGSVYFLE